MSATTAIVESGFNVYASAGAVAQHGGKLKIYVHNACGEQVVWCQSQKTGRFYLVNVRQGASEWRPRFYMGHDLHKCQAGS
jgi:hypothetical protein